MALVVSLLLGDGALRAAIEGEAAALPRDPPPMAERIGLVREARLLFGAPVARTLWLRLGLPPPPPPPITDLDDAWQCLRHLLDDVLYVPDGPTVRVALERALDDDEHARSLLLAVGVRVMPEADAFIVANRHPGLERVYGGTRWFCAHSRVLRRLPGVEPTGRQIGDNRSRGSLLPGGLLDQA
jgi:hypothetical protein